jgi:hypothetical protein
MNNYLKAVLVVIVLGAITWAGITYPQFVQPTGAASPVATTFNDAKVAAINFSPLATPATTTSILNSDGGDRLIIDGFVACTGIGTFTNSPAAGGGPLANWTFLAATTSASTPANISALTNFVLNSNVATSTPVNYVATTTNPVLGNAGRIWASGSYLTFWVNATSTAACNVGVHYLGT